MTFTSPALDRLRVLRSQGGAHPAPPSAATKLRPEPQKTSPQPDPRQAAPAPLPSTPPRPVPPPYPVPPYSEPPPRPRPGTPPKPLNRLQAKHTPAPETEQPRPPKPLTLGGLPQHLAAMVAQAQRGELPGGVHLLAGGLVMDLNGYVIAWAEGWPGDTAHILSRLEQAYDVLRWSK